MLLPLTLALSHEGRGNTEIQLKPFIPHSLDGVRGEEYLTD